MQVAYLTVHTPDGDAIFEVDGLSPPEVHARLSRVLQGLQRSERPPMPIAIERGPAPAPIAAPDPVPEPIPEPVVAPEPTVAASPSVAHRPLAIDPETSDAPLEVLVVDALWKLARLHEAGLVDDAELQGLRTRILARVPGLVGTPVTGPLLHV